MAELGYFQDVDDLETLSSSFSFFDFLKSVKESLFELLPPLPLYYPVTQEYLSEIKLPDGKKLFISDANSASNRDLVLEHQIKGIVSIRTTYAYLSPIYKKIDELNDIVDIHHVFMNDNPQTSLIEHINPMFSFIDEHLNNNQHVLIQCTAGKSRSVSFVILYLMIKYNKMYQDSFDMIQIIRPQIKINDGFIKQLKTMELVLSNKL
jgi:predicted protein tyrosine phosphatase